MIYKITIENFFSIADRQELVLNVPVNAPDVLNFHSSRANAKTRLPIAIGLFGANASGKSTVLRSLVSTAAFVEFSFNIFTIVDSIWFFQPYKRADWWTKPSKVVIEFDGLGEKANEFCLFRYELHIAHDYPNFGKEVTYEALFYAPKGKFKRLFERRGQKFIFSKEFGISSHDPQVNSIRPNASIFSTLAQFNHPQSKNMIMSLQGLQTNICGLDKAPTDINHWVSYYARNPNSLDHLNRQLKRLDLGLEGMRIESGPKGLFPTFTHIGLDDHIFFHEESNGTRRFIEMFYKLHYVLEVGGVAIIDELDMDLHSMVVPEVLRWFYDPDRNLQKAQLFFTAHNPILLDELEKEQIFFTEKPSGQPTKVYGACDIKGLRREPSLMKKYLGGELGAIPYIG